MSDKILVSGIGPGVSGVGRLMQTIVPMYVNNGYKILYKREPSSIRRFLYSKKYLSIIIELIRRLFDDFIFTIKCMNIYGKTIIFIHPQTAGYKNLFKLVENNEVSIYVMDCSFFCIRSYNMHPVLYKECIQCLGDISPHKSCSPLPTRMNRKLNIRYLNKLLSVSQKIKFLAQNNKQEILLKNHFGNDVTVEIVGNHLNDVSEITFDLNKHDCENKYSIVYHAAPIVEKGVIYVIRLAKLMPNYSFLIPAHRKDVIRVLGGEIVPENISCVDMTWESGLKECVSCADMVINPSLWSAPIEGALLKSAFYNKNVATVKSQYGYEAEFKGIKNHLRLNDDVIIAVKEIKQFLRK